MRNEASEFPKYLSHIMLPYPMFSQNAHGAPLLTIWSLLGASVLFVLGEYSRWRSKTGDTN